MNINIFNCKIKIEFSLIAFITIMTLIDKSYNIILSLTAALIHEFGHILYMYIIKKPPKKIILNILGANIENSNSSILNYKNEIILMIFGPLLNFIFFILFYFFYFINKNYFYFIFSANNLFLGLFNMLPIESLDGGKIIYSFLRIRFNEKTTKKTLNILSLLVLFPIFIISFYILLKSKYNFSLLIISCYLILSILIKEKLFI